MAKENSRKTSQGFVEINKNTLPELKDLLERQNKLLNNELFIRKLPDKGMRIRLFKEKIEEEIRNKDDVDEASHLMSKLSLKGLPNEIEWTGTKALQDTQGNDSDNDSDDDPNPLKLIATHSGTQKSYIKKQEPPTKSLVNSNDLEDLKNFDSRDLSYTKKMCSKYDSVPTLRERFKPNQPKQLELAKTGFKSSSEHVKKLMGKHWEVTAATPPVPVHAATEMVSLADSLALQKQQALKLQEIQMEEAMTRLRESSSLKFDARLPTRNLMQYRNPTDPTDLFEGTPVRTHNEDNLCQDDDNLETGGAVFYNIIDDLPDTS